MDVMLVEVAAVVFTIVFAYILREISTMKAKQSGMNERLGIEESKGGSRDKIAEKTLALLDKIHTDIGSIKEEQGYWRGRHDLENPS